ncbi:HD domain-containing protein [Paenibacillus sp. NEAU-GSW1]|nr:HD domain-containing protein [Paenibacillus sp. NEAU-GSW1]
MALPLCIYAGLRLTGSSLDANVQSPHGHFYIVSIVSVISLIVAIAIGIAATRLRNLKISFLSLSYVSLAALFTLHGISTPGFLNHHLMISGTAAQLSLLLAVLWLWLSSISSDRFLIRFLSRWQRWLVPVWTAALAVLFLALWMYPGLTHGLHLKDNPVRWIVTAVIVVFNLWTMFRYWQTYMTSRFPLQLAIVYGTGWMIIAQIIIVTGEAWKLSWWLYHLLLLASVAAMAAGIRLQYRSTGSLTTSMLHLFRSNPQDWIHVYMSPAVKELIRTTENRDAYTAGHNYRVAIYALKLSEEMGLSLNQLRAIAQGGLVHDVGKLGISRSILNKPGKLTKEERVIIEEHPVKGYNLCRRLGFMQEELSVVRSHHERWDGSGYPDRLSGSSIPLLARVTAVADVYDALTSSRAYREAMSHEEALAYIRSEKGKHFDPACVDAMLRLADRQAEFFRETIALSREPGRTEKSASSLHA